MPRRRIFFNGTVTSPPSDHQIVSHFSLREMVRPRASQNRERVTLAVRALVELDSAKS